MMTLDPNEQCCQEDNDSQSRDDDLKNSKNTPLYKDTMTLLKQRMCAAHELCEQFNGKLREYENLNLELHQSKLDKEKLFNKYNSASEKLARLELSIKDHEKSRNDYKNTADKQKLELDEKKKHIEQLEFKMKIMEKDNCRLKDEMKKKEQESKAAKSKKASKNQACQTNCYQRQDAAVNTELGKASSKKPQTRDKNTMTNRAVNTCKDPFDFYCSECKNQIDPPPVGQIFKLMSVPPPQLTNPFSPPGSPRSIPSSSRQSESITNNTVDQYFDENPSYFDKIEKSRKTNVELDGPSNGPSFMLIDKLNRRINNLERLVKKKKKRQANYCRQTCSPSKNIKFIVQLPNEEKYFEYAKQQSRKQRRLKRLNKKQIKTKNKKKSRVKGWQVENDAPSKNVESNVPNVAHQPEQKYKNLVSINEKDLFESPAIVEQVSIDSYSPEAMVNSKDCHQQTPHMESLNKLDTSTDISCNQQTPHTEFLNKLDTSTDAMDIENDDEFTMESCIGKQENPIQESKPPLEKIDDLDSKNCKDDAAIRGESDEKDVINEENVEMACKNVEESHKDGQKTKLDIERVCMSSAVSSENGDSSLMSIFSLSSDEDSHLDLKPNTVISLPGSRRSSIESSNLVENVEEQSSDDSLQIKCSASVKRGNVIESEDSCEESLSSLDRNARRKKLLAKRKQLITKIRNLKKTSKKPMISSIKIEKKEEKKEEKREELPDDTVSPYIPTKKQRVAHKPKDASEVKAEKIEDACETQKSKPRAKKTKPAKDLPRTTKKFKLMENVEPVSNDDKQATNGATESSQLMQVQDETREMEMETNGEEIDDQKKEEENQITLEITATENESTENCSTACENETLSNAGDNDLLDDSKEELVEKDQDKMPTRQLRCRNVVVEKSPRKTAAVEKSPRKTVARGRPKASEPASDPKNDTAIPEAPVCKKPKNKKASKSTKLPFIKTFNSTNSSLSDTSILSHLNKFLLEETSKEDKEDNRKHLYKNEKLVREQLSLLMKSEPLEEQVLVQVSENLLSLDGVALDTVAMVLVEYAATEYLDDTTCDKTYTPPAPPMTKFEQKLVTLIASINEKEPEFVDAVEKGMQYKLFRLGKAVEVHAIERLFRVLILLNKIIKKDREKVRMLIADALYSYNTRAMNIIYIALSCWSEVFPRYDSSNDILIKTVVHIIMSLNVNRPFSKLMSLKNLLNNYYGYPNAGYRVETFLEELMSNLKENAPGVNTAVILLCKSKGPEWTLDNVIPRLKRIVVEQVHPSMYDALTLLGNLLRPLSADNLKPKLEEITDQLCHVLSESGGAHDLNEGIVSCLLNIGGKFAFRREKIAHCVLQWQPAQDLRPTTKEKLDSFLKTHNPGWWRKFVQQNFPASE